MASLHPLDWGMLQQLNPEMVISGRSHVSTTPNQEGTTMANYRVTIGAGNGYSAQKVEISGVTTQAAAKKVAEAQYPGARIVGVTRC